MDSQHRHELEENSLAKWLEREIESLKPKMPAILVGVIALIGGSLGWSAYQDSMQAQQAEAWRDFSLGLEGVRPNLSVLKQTAEEHPETSVEEWSLITWADGRLWNAATLYMRDRAKADTALEEAEATYGSLTNAANGDIVGRANYGLGRVLEMKGELEEAIKKYNKVSGMFAEIAKERAEVIATSNVKKSYAWITKVQAAPAAEEGEASDADLNAEEAIDPTTTLDDLLRDSIDTTEEGDEAETEADAQEADAAEADADSADSKDE